MSPVRRRKVDPDDATVLTIEGESVVARMPVGVEARTTVAELFERLTGGAPDTRGLVLPEGTQALVPTRMGFVLVHQTAPAVHGLRWIRADSGSDFGPGTRYRDVRLSLPYLIVLAVFESGRGCVQLSRQNECFFSLRPLGRQGMDTPLCFPALLNCSRVPDDPRLPLSWICTQHLSPREVAGGPDLHLAVHDGLRALLRHLLDSGFNRSSERHELSSWFTETVRAAIDPRLASVEAWEAASAADPLFALEVPWLPTGKTLGEVIERARARLGGPGSRIQSASDLARFVFNQKSRSRRSG